MLNSFLLAHGRVGGNLPEDLEFVWIEGADDFDASALASVSSSEYKFEFFMRPKWSIFLTVALPD